MRDFKKSDLPELYDAVIQNIEEVPRWVLEELLKKMQRPKELTASQEEKKRFVEDLQLKIILSIRSGQTKTIRESINKKLKNLKPSTNHERKIKAQYESNKEKTIDRVAESLEEFGFNMDHFKQYTK